MNRLVVYRDRAIDLLQDILQSSREKTLLVICSSREEFLEQLAQSVLAGQGVSEAGSRTTAETIEASAPPPPALVPTLQTLSNSKRTQVAFCENVDMLRSQMMSLPAVGPGPQPRCRPLLQMVDLVMLHHGTSEFSVQGIMRTLASAVEGAEAAGMDLRLCECQDACKADNTERGPRLWDREVPLVSESTRLGVGEAAWSQTMVPVRAIARRWFKFEKAKSQSQESVNDDEEMLL